MFFTSYLESAALFYCPDFKHKANIHRELTSCGFRSVSLRVYKFGAEDPKTEIFSPYLVVKIQTTCAYTTS